MSNGLRICFGVRLTFSAVIDCIDKSNSHLFYTIPPAVALTAAYRPLGTSIDVYKVLFLVVVRYRTLSWLCYMTYVP